MEIISGDTVLKDPKLIVNKLNSYFTSIGQIWLIQKIEPTAGCLLELIDNNNNNNNNNKRAMELIEEIGRRCTIETDDQRETAYLYQRISIAIQRGNALAFTHTFNTDTDST